MYAAIAPAIVAISKIIKVEKPSVELTKLLKGKFLKSETYSNGKTMLMLPQNWWYR